MAKIHQLPPVQSPIDVHYVRRLGVQSYDKDNLYPQNVLRIVSASATGSGCLERYKDFMEGDGLASAVLSEVKVNRQGETLADINALICDDMATFDGFALHINYNEQGQPVELHAVPFENVRLCEPNAEGIVTHVALHPDWAGATTWAGEKVKVVAENVDYIDIYNPDPSVVRAQMANAGGISFYKGQVLYVSSAGYLRYPLAFFDAVLTDMSTDEGISNLMLRNARNNFMPAGAFVHFTGQGSPDGEEDYDSGYSETLKSLQGDMNALAILDIECENRDEIPEFVPFTGKNIDKDFTATDAAVKESIYAKFGQEAFLAVRLGKLGFSGTIMAEANDDYARRCIKRQKRITRALVDVMSKWHEPLIVTPDLDSLRILPLTYAVKTIDEFNA